MALYRLRDNKAIVFDNGEWFCDHKKLEALCGKCGVWLIENGIRK